MRRRALPENTWFWLGAAALAAAVAGLTALRLSPGLLAALLVALTAAVLGLLLWGSRTGHRRPDWQAVFSRIGEECAVLGVRPETGLVVWATPAAIRLLGDAPQTPVGQRLDQLRPSWVEESTHRLLTADGAAHAAVTETSGPWLGPAGEIIWARTVGVTLSDPPPPVAVLLLQDLTDQRRMEEALGRQSEELRQVAVEQAEAQERLARLETRAAGLFQHSLDAIFLVETESHTIVQANPAATLLTGYPADQLIARPFSDLDPSVNLRYSRELLTAAEAGSPRPIQLRRADGTVAPVEATSAVLSHGAYRMIEVHLRGAEAQERVRQLEEAVALLRREVQALEAQRSRLEAAHRAQSDFLAEMGHELRLPLNAIVGFSELLEASPDPLTPRQRQYLTDLRQAGEHLLSLVSDLLDLAQLEAGRLTVQSEPLALGPLVESVAAVAQALGEPRRMRLTVRVADPALGAWGDERRVKQVLYNLLHNALRYSPPGTEVVVEAGQEPGWTRVSVRDQGPGIPPEYQERIFQEFVRLPVANEQAAPPGTGLGLALSLRLAQAMGGRLTVDSAPGAGSEFSLFLPRYDPAEAAQPAASTIG